MVRYLSTFRLKPGFNPEETYKIWQEVHAPRVKKIIGKWLKKYTISRIAAASADEPQFFGMVQLWFDDIDTARGAMAKLASTTPDEFQARVTDRRAVLVIEEKEIKL